MLHAVRAQGSGKGAGFSQKLQSTRSQVSNVCVMRGKKAVMARSSSRRFWPTAHRIACVALPAVPVSQLRSINPSTSLCPIRASITRVRHRAALAGRSGHPARRLGRTN